MLPGSTELPLCCRSAIIAAFLLFCAGSWRSSLAADLESLLCRHQMIFEGRGGWAPIRGSRRLPVSSGPACVRMMRQVWSADLGRLSRSSYRRPLARLDCCHSPWTSSVTVEPARRCSCKISTCVTSAGVARPFRVSGSTPTRHRGLDQQALEVPRARPAPHRTTSWEAGRSIRTGSADGLKHRTQGRSGTGGGPKRGVSRWCRRCGRVGCRCCPPSWKSASMVNNGGRSATGHWALPGPRPPRRNQPKQPSSRAGGGRSVSFDGCRPRRAATVRGRLQKAPGASGFSSWRRPVARSAVR